MKTNPSDFMSLPAERYPNRPCLSCEGYESTYAETNERANRLAWSLMNRGNRQGSRVATLLSNGHQIVESFIALWKAGCINIPLNVRSSVQENIAVLQDAKVETLIFGSDFLDQVEILQRHTPSLKLLICDGPHEGTFENYENMLATSCPQEPNIEVDENDAHRIQYSSGTTGCLRGIIQTYRNRRESVSNMFMNTDRLICKDEVILHIAPLTHAAIQMLMSFYLKGAKHIIREHFDTDSILKTIEQNKVTCTLLVPTMIIMLLENESVSKYDLSSLKRVFYGTAPMSVEHLKRAISIFGNIFRQNYGLSEANQPLTYLSPEEHVIDGQEWEVKRLGSAGRRSLGPEVKIVGIDNNDDEVPVNEIGEIIVRGPHVSPGYFNQPEITAQANTGGWFHTGDLAYQDDDGYIFIVDRKKDMIISGGFNIYSREIELVLERHPAISEVAVVGVHDDKWGEVVKAFIVLEKSQQVLTQEGLVAFCLEHGLAKYKIPKAVELVAELPKNKYGKIVKMRLK